MTGQDGTDGPCDVDELAALELFEGLDAIQLSLLCEHGSSRSVDPGWVFRQGEPADDLFVLLSGSVVVFETVLGAEVEVVRAHEPGTYGGAVGAHLRDDGGSSYRTSMKAVEPSRFFILPAHAFAALMREWFPMAVRLLEGLAVDARSTREVTEQRARLLALGSLTAGLTHQLNNPAASAVAAAGALRNRVGRMREKLAHLAAGDYTREQVMALVRTQELAVASARETHQMSVMEASDRQDALVSWLEAYEIVDGWDLAPTFAQVGLRPDFLTRVLSEVGSELLEDAVRWLNYSIEIELLIDEVAESTRRISELVASVKQYTQMDRGPQQMVDVRALLDATLLVFGRRIAGADVTVIKEYDPATPHVPAYALELNQVWTNLIDNALDAMAGHGTLILRSRADADHVIVEVVDSGPGVPAELQSRIFDPFFTTKPFGEGTGLGLDVAAHIVASRHRGQLQVQSRPGETRMIVRLPRA